MRARRAELAAMALGAALGAASVAIWSGRIEVVAAAALLGGSLGVARRHSLAAWLVAAVALLATVPQGVLGLPTYLLVPVHAFCAARWGSRWSGLAGAATLIAASEVGVLVAHDSAVPFMLVPAAAWAAGRALREREQVAPRRSSRCATSVRGSPPSCTTSSPTRSA